MRLRQPDCPTSPTAVDAIFCISCWLQAVVALLVWRRSRTVAVKAADEVVGEPKVWSRAGLEHVLKKRGVRNSKERDGHIEAARVKCISYCRCIAISHFFFSVFSFPLFIPPREPNSTVIVTPHPPLISPESHESQPMIGKFYGVGYHHCSLNSKCLTSRGETSSVFTINNPLRCDFSCF